MSASIPTNNEAPIKLNIGCGDTIYEGFIGVDMVKTSGAAIVAYAWEIGLHVRYGTVDEIVCEHMIEHLTNYDFQRSINEWYKLLKPGGIIHIECPDFEAVCKGFAEGNEYERYVSANGSWSWAAQLHGNQRGSTSFDQLAQTHKSSYTKARLISILEGLRFTEISEEAPVKQNSGPCMRFKARKPQNGNSN